MNNKTDADTDEEETVDWSERKFQVYVDFDDTENGTEKKEETFVVFTERCFEHSGILLVLSSVKFYTVVDQMEKNWILCAI